MQAPPTQGEGLPRPWGPGGAGSLVAPPPPGPETPALQSGLTGPDPGSTLSSRGGTGPQPAVRLPGKRHGFAVSGETATRGPRHGARTGYTLNQGGDGFQHSGGPSAPHALPSPLLSPSACWSSDPSEFCVSPPSPSRPCASWSPHGPLSTGARAAACPPGPPRHPPSCPQVFLAMPPPDPRSSPCPLLTLHPAAVSNQPRPPLWGWVLSQHRAGTVTPGPRVRVDHVHAAERSPGR